MTGERATTETTGPAEVRISPADGADGRYVKLTVRARDGAFRLWADMTTEQLGKMLTGMGVEVTLRTLEVEVSHG